MGKGARALVGLFVIVALVLPAPAGAGHRTCWGAYDCCDLYGEHGNYPRSAGTESWRATPLLGARADADWSYPSPTGSFTVTTSARGAPTRVDTGVGSVNAQLMGSGTGDAEARKLAINCGVNDRASVVINFSSQDATGSLAYAQVGEAAESWIEAKAYFYAIVCTSSGGYSYYWSCSLNDDYYSTAYARTACFPSYSGGCTKPSSITLSADVPHDGCSYYSGPQCIGVYSSVSVFSHSFARGTATASASASGTIGSTGGY